MDTKNTLDTSLGKFSIESKKKKVPRRPSGPPIPSTGRSSQSDVLFLTERTRGSPPAGPTTRPLTGRAVRHRKLRVDQCHRLDLAELRRKGVLDGLRGNVWACTQPLNLTGDSRVHLSLLEAPDGARGMGLVHDDPATGRMIGYLARLTWTPCHFGGGRWWWQCPLVVDGRPCQRRCRILYRPAGASYFACRVCHQLTYRSRQRHRDKWYEGFSRPMELLDEETRRPAWTLSHRQRARRLRSMTKAIDAMERFPRLLRRDLGEA